MAILIIILTFVSIFCININKNKISDNSVVDPKESNIKMNDLKEMPKVTSTSKNGTTTEQNSAQDKFSKNQNNANGIKNGKISKDSKPLGKNFSSEGTYKKDKINDQDWNEICSWNLILLNDDNVIPPGKEHPKLLEYKGVKVHAKVLPYLKNMIDDAKNAGINLWISSCYRSIKEQTKLHNIKINYYLKKGYNMKDAKIMACRVVAAPGTSEHNLGMAVDFNGVLDSFYKTKEYAWLISNAQEYGFILRYPKEKQNITKKIYEPWHFRYIGREHAKNIKKLGMCFEEYVEYLKGRKS